MPSISALSCVDNFSQGTVYQGFAIDCGVDYFGDDLSNVPSVSLSDCIDICSATAGCVDVSYVPDQQTCYLKSATSNKHNDSGVWTAKKDTTVTCADNASQGQIYDGFVISCGVDYYGGDISNLQTDTFTACIDACSNTAGCVDVSFLGTTCYLKNRLTQSSDNVNVWTATKQGAASGSPSVTSVNSGLTCAPGDITKSYTTSKDTYDIHCNMDYYGGDLKSTQTSTFEECIAACELADSCIDVSYLVGTCYMKNFLTTLTPANNVWTAVLKSALDTSSKTDSSTLSCVNNKDDGRVYMAQSGAKYQIACGIDYYGGDLSFTTVTTLESCIEECDNTASCVDVAYTGGGCYLKSSLTPAVGNPNVIGAKQYAVQPSSSLTASTTSPASTTAPTTSTTTSASFTSVVTTTTYPTPINSSSSTTASGPITTTFSASTPAGASPTPLTTTTSAMTPTSVTSTSTSSSAPATFASPYPLDCADYPNPVTIGGKKFQPNCGSYYIGSQGVNTPIYPVIFNLPNLGECLAICAANPACVAVDFATTISCLQLSVASSRTGLGHSSARLVDQ